MNTEKAPFSNDWTQFGANFRGQSFTTDRTVISAYGHDSRTNYNYSYSYIHGFCHIDLNASLDVERDIARDDL